MTDDGAYLPWALISYTQGPLKTEISLPKMESFNCHFGINGIQYTSYCNNQLVMILIDYMTSDLATLPILVMHDDDANDNQKGSIDGCCTGFDSDDDRNNNDHDVNDDDDDPVGDIFYDASDDDVGGDVGKDGLLAAPSVVLRKYR